ncbi:hypothetical protein MTP99_008535 [Tenebrio molitor]|nr:hypothetical protein MTP99_008535 [Tenebrio molitor]
MELQQHPNLVSVVHRFASSWLSSRTHHLCFLAVPATFRCPSCDKWYLRKSSLNNHRKFECGKEPNYFCATCPYKTKIKGNLRRHVRTHSTL